MAIVAFTAYSGKNECARVNGYIADGHGASSMTRINRYISDGHGGGTECLGHFCPSDPVLATAFMEAIHWNYDRQHSFNKARTKGRVDHVQLYVSPTEEDNVPSEERLQMTRELIERTALRDFPSIYIAHDNTDVGHCHISLCPFSMDGSHKLCMNNRLLYDLRREMDRICVEHGYSIIENPELWGDKAYRDWFMELKAEGRITIHPPRDQSNTIKKEEKKRARDFVRSKQAKAKRREEQLQFYREIRVPDTPEKAQYFFTSPYLFHPANPEKPLQVMRIRPDGKERTELELRAAALGLWAHTCRTLLEERNVPGTESLTKRMQTIAGKSFEAMRLFVDLDIRTHEEMVQHIVCCGREIGSLKRKIKQQNEILQELQPAQNALEQWDYEKAEEALSCLAALGYNTKEKMEKLRSKSTQALARKEKYIFRLEERNKEYRKLKTAEKTMDPLTCKDAWENYLNGLFRQNRIQKANQCSEEELEERICQLGQMLGISDDTMDRYLNEAQEYAERLRNYEERRKSYREYWDRIFLVREKEEKGYQQYEESSNQCAYRGGMRRMAKELGISVNSATNAMKLLLERNLIIKKQRYANRFWYIVNMEKVQELCGNVAIFDTRMHRKLVPDNIDEKMFLVIRDSYSKICKSLPKITELTQAQKHMLSTLLKTYTVDEIKKGFLLAEESDYLKGSNGAWRADFDWLIRPDNIRKVLEKRYTNYRKANIPGWTDKGDDISDEEMEMIRQALSEA